MASEFVRQASGPSTIDGKPVGPVYLFPLSFEENFDVAKTLEWFHEYAHVPFIIGIGIYLPVLYFGQKIMANRQPMNLKGPLIVWNFALAIFSILGFIRVAPEFFYVWRTFGFEHTICNNSYLQSKPAIFWVYLFVLSKTPELVDTLFLVLKKQKLIFLHVYHHATVLIFAWFVLAYSVGAARWFCTMNFGVHSIMYTYYALKALPNLIRIPKWVSMLITTSQTLQMVAGSYAVAMSFYRYMSGGKCDTNTRMSIAGLVIYLSYLILFSHFFYKSYCSPSPSKPLESGKKNV